MPRFKSVYYFIKKSLLAVGQAGDLRSAVSAPAFYKYRVPAHNFQEYNIYLE